MLQLATVIAAIVGIGVILVFTGLGRLIAGTPSVEDRLEAYVPQAPPSVGGTDLVEVQKRRTPVGRALRRLAFGQGFEAAMAADLAQANLPLTVTEYMLWRVVSVSALLVLSYAFSRQIVIALLGGIVGYFLPRIYVQRRQAKRLVAFQLQLPDVLTLLVGALRSGYGLTIAMDTVGKQMPAPTSEEFRRVVTEIGLGVSNAQALANLVRRIRSDDLDLVVTAITIQYEVGGNLAVILETITHTIRERIRVKEQARVLTAQVRLQRIILTAMPFGLGVVIYVLNPTYMMGLFTPGPTLIIPAAAVTLMAIGYVVMGKMSNIEI